MTPRKSRETSRRPRARPVLPAEVPETVATPRPNEAKPKDEDLPDEITRMLVAAYT